jgi:hypothetical protein
MRLPWRGRISAGVVEGAEKASGREVSVNGRVEVVVVVVVVNFMVVTSLF